MFIDYSKVKRFFSFGCSFTSHVYPTWADVLSSEMPKATFYNFGQTGAGNILISSRVTEANHKFQFTEEDLVIVMFSTFYREDRYVKDGWIAKGNIYNNCIYGDDFVKNFADPIGYLIRDFSLIELITTYLKTLPCQSKVLISCNILEDLEMGERFFKSDQNSKVTINTVIETYSKLISSLPKSLKEIVEDSNKLWKTGHSYLIDGKMSNDPHPNPLMYYNYLKTLGFNLTEKSDNYVRHAMDKLKIYKNKNDFSIIFPILDNNQNLARRLLF